MASEPLSPESVLALQDILISNILPLMHNDDLLQISAVSKKLNQTARFQKQYIPPHGNTLLSRILNKLKTQKMAKEDLLKILEYFKAVRRKYKITSDYYHAFNQLSFFKDYNRVSDLYKTNKVESKNKTDGISRNISIISGNERNELSNNLLVLLLVIPPIAIGTLIYLAWKCGAGDYTPSSREAYYFALLFFPPLLLYHIGWLIYSAIKWAIQESTAQRKIDAIEWNSDEISATLERIMSSHDNQPATFRGEDQYCDPEVIKQRDELFALFLGPKFEGTNSTGIKNIQETMSKHPNISCEKCFTLIQDEINQRVTNRYSTYSRIKESYRAVEMRELYTLVNGDKYYLDYSTQLNLISSSEDRKTLINFIKSKSSFVYVDQLSQLGYKIS